MAAGISTLSTLLATDLIGGQVDAGDGAHISGGVDTGAGM